MNIFAEIKKIYIYISHNTYMTWQV